MSAGSSFLGLGWLFIFFIFTCVFKYLEAQYDPLENSNFTPATFSNHFGPHGVYHSTSWKWYCTHPASTAWDFKLLAWQNRIRHHPTKSRKRWSRSTRCAVRWKIIQDLAMIDSFAAEMPASAALKIASHPSVRWVSLDAPLVASNCRGCVDTTS